MCADRLIRGLAKWPTDKSATMRMLVVESGALCEQARIIHALGALGTVALSRALTGGLLLASLAKSERNVNLQFAGDGPLGTVFVDAEPSIGVRGYTARNPTAALRFGGVRPSLGLALGQTGYLNVIRADQQGNLFRGSVSLRTGEIDDDIGEYLRSSEQVESAIALDVVLSEEGHVERAGGVLLQALPGNEGVIGDLRERLQSRVLYRSMVQHVNWADKLAEALGVEIDVLETESVEYRCNCSENRVKAALLACGATELTDMIEKEGKAEITCDFCRRHFVFDREELAKLRDLAVSVAISHKSPDDHDDN